MIKCSSCESIAKSGCYGNRVPKALALSFMFCLIFLKSVYIVEITKILDDCENLLGLIIFLELWPL